MLPPIAKVVMKSSVYYWLFLWLYALPLATWGEAWQADKIEVLFAEESVELPQLLPSLTQADVVIVGEYHDDWASHQLQFWLLKALFENDPSWALGVEWLALTEQESLDAFLAGKIDSFQLLQASDYLTNWGYDFRLLAPIFNWMRAQKRQMIALNAPKSITKKVSQFGLSGLDQQDKALIPWPLLPLSEKYQAWLTDFFQKSHLPAERIDKALQVQSVWDQAMAQSIIRTLEARQGKLLVFAGQVHAGKGQGVADALGRLKPSLKVVTLGGGRFDDWREDAFDYYALLPEENLPPLPSLGLVFSGSELEVEKVVAGSLAEKLGIKPGDRLLSLDRFNLERFADLKYALWLVAYGKMKQQVTLTWQTENELLELPEVGVGKVLLRE